MKRTLGDITDLEFSYYLHKELEDFMEMFFSSDLISLVVIDS